MDKKNNKKVLVIAPHPDDEVLGCGGTILKHKYNSDDVIVCIVSVRNQPLFTEDMHVEQFIEVKKAHEVLEVDESIVLDFDSVMLDKVPHYKLNESLANIVNKVKPDIVYIPFVGDIHLDHQLVAKSALVACRPISKHVINRILMYETQSETEWNFPKSENIFIPNVYEDITDFIEKKLDAMNQYKDQKKEFPHPRSNEKIKALAAMRGGVVSINYAEAFMLVRDIII